MTLANPERRWARAHVSVDRAEVESRIGAVKEQIELLSGGLANANVRVGDRVLRIYRRDPGALGKEATLLARGWRSFRVPAVLARGPDFLVLEYMPHDALEDAHGALVGAALAEIHATAFPQAGFLSAELAVGRPFPDLVSAFREHVRSCFESASCKLSPALRERVTRALATREPELRELASRPVLLHGDWKVSNLHAARDGLLVLDWEFAYAGPALLDVGQLLRWRPPREFVRAFEASYRACGGALPEAWERWAAVFDLFNLAGLASRPDACERCLADVSGRIEETLAS